MGHLDSQRSLPVIGDDKAGLSALAKKLRLAAEHEVAVVNAPDGHLELLRPGPAALSTNLVQGQSYDAVLLFVRDAAELRRLAPSAIAAVRPNALLWIAYPKGGQTVGATDLPATPWWVQSDVLGELTGVTGWKPVSFVAVDEVWTALRFKKA